MATIRKRGEVWQAQVRRTGYAPQSASFKLRADALAWSREREAALDRGLGQPQSCAGGKVTLAAILQRYGVEVASLKRGASQELQRLHRFCSHPIAELGVSKITPAHEERCFRPHARKVGVNLDGNRKRAVTQSCRRWMVPAANADAAAVATDTGFTFDVAATEAAAPSR